MEFQELTTLAVIAVFIVVSLYLQVRFGGSDEKALFHCLTRICQGCRQPLARPRPKRFPHCGTKVQWRWL